MIEYRYLSPQPKQLSCCSLQSQQNSKINKIPSKCTMSQKKAQCHFPAAKIKKIIQENQQIGKLCNTVPFLVQKSLEIFLNDVLDNIEAVAKNKEVAKLTPPILKKALEMSKYDFMKGSLADVEEIDLGVKKRRSKVSAQDEDDGEKVVTTGRKKRKCNK